MHGTTPDAERRDKLRLIRSANVGPVTYFQLIARFGSAAAALEAIPNLAARGGGRAPQVASIAQVEAEMRAVDKLGARYLFVGEGLYPSLLAELDTAPPALIVKGNMALLERPSVAIVGARNASAAACRFARGLAHDLAREGCIVVSGLARGIDTAAHQGAVDLATAGVIASGIDIAFPPENAELQDRVAQQGVLIAEQVPGREPLARHFTVAQSHHCRNGPGHGGDRGRAEVGQPCHRTAGKRGRTRSNGRARQPARSARTGV